VFAFPAFADCPTIQDYITEGVGDNFLLQGVFEKIASISSTVAEKTWDAFSLPLRTVLSIAMGIYFAVYTLKNIGSFSKQDVASYLSKEKTGIINIGVKVGVVMFLLTDVGNSFLYGNLIIPVINTCMMIGIKFISGSGSGELDTIMNSSPDDVRGLFSSVIKLVGAFNEKSYTVVALGKELICLAWRPSNIFLKEWALIPFGLLIYVMGWMICIGLAFYLLDVMIRLGVGCMVLPFAVACGIYKPTTVYTNKTWGLFMNVAFNFVLLGMVVSIILELIASAMGGNDNSALMQKILNNGLLSEDETESLAEGLSFKRFILITMCCMVGFKIFSEIEKLVDRISETSSVGKGGQQAGAMAGKQVKGVLRQGGNFAKAAGKVAAKDAAKNSKKMGDKLRHTKVGRAVEKGLRNVKAAALKFQRRMGL
jgi:hypothetical protein